MSTASISAKDLTKEAPTSPRVRVGGYVILARMADKGRATLAGSNGDYHFDCTLDNILFGFKGVKSEDVKAQLAAGATNEDLAAWLDSHGTPKTAEEIKAWSDGVEAYSLAQDPEKKEWFAGECAKLGLDPETTSVFSWLEADDRASVSLIGAAA
jgi:hypothetical protein